MRFPRMERHLPSGRESQVIVIMAQDSPFEVRWGIATHMNKEQQRKIIGNSLAVIIFNDSGSILPA